LHICFILNKTNEKSFLYFFLSNAIIDSRNVFFISLDSAISICIIPNTKNDIIITHNNGNTIVYLSFRELIGHIFQIDVSFLYNMTRQNSGSYVCDFFAIVFSRDNKTSCN